MQLHVQYHFSRGHSERANAVGFGTFCRFSELLVCCAKLSFRGGRGGMCILFEICGKMAFQKCMGWVGGGWGDHISEHRAETWMMYGTEHCKGDQRLFRI